MIKTYKIDQKNSFPNELDELKDYRLTASQMNFFNSNGYLVVKGLYSVSEIEEIASNTYELKKTAFQLYQDPNIIKTPIVSRESYETGFMHKGSQYVIQNLNEVTGVARVVWAGDSKVQSF